jgi:cytochrome c oxidase subunit II
MKKTILISILAISLFLIVACSTTQTTPNSTSAALPADHDDSDDHHDEGATTESAGNVREIEIIAKQWEFIPSVINVKHGETVELHIESIDVRHGIMVPELGINVDLLPRKDAHVKFTADKKGEFSFFCNVPCGRGHSDMIGKIVVE